MIAAHIAPHVAKTTIDTPWGPALIARSQVGLTGLWFGGQKDHPGALNAVEEDGSDPLLQRCRAQVQEYAAGQRGEFELPLDLHGTVFQRAVWQALLKIPHGELSTYGEIAEILNQPQASRAVGAAVGLNPISIIVPCHRVVGSNASLTGYAGGLHRKVALLQLEGLTIRGQRVHPRFETASLI